MTRQLEAHETVQSLCAAEVIATRFDHREDGKRIVSPTLIVAGSSDLPVPVFHARRLHEAIAGSKLVVVDGGRHCIPLFRVQEFFELVVDHLEAHGSR